MKARQRLDEMLKRYKPFLAEQFKVKEIGVFGSYARDEASDESDVDILVEFREPIGWEFFDLKEFLEDILGKEVDLTTPRALKPQLRDEILRQVAYV